MEFAQHQLKLLYISLLYQRKERVNMEIKRAIEICKDIYSPEYSKEDKDAAIKIISNNWAKIFRKITKGDLLRIIEYQMDILGI